MLTPSDDPILSLSDGELMDLASALRSGRVALPPSTAGLSRILGPTEGESVSASLRSWAALGLSVAQVAWALELVANSRHTRATSTDSIDLVLTGPGTPEIASRDTAAVVHELFSQAEQAVIVVGYAIHKGHRVFKALADRMRARPELVVRMFFDVQPGPEAITESESVGHFRQRFVSSEWPQGYALPEVFCYPPTLRNRSEARSCLHAKCVIIDRQLAFVSSANFTEAAQERNIEAGVLVRSQEMAGRLAQYFESLVASGILARVV